MNRNLRISSLIALSVLAGCDDKITQPGMFPNRSTADGGGADGASTGHRVPSPKCNGACCPADTACYATPPDYSGPECLAQFDNTGQDRWQLRQTWSVSELPLGNSVANLNLANVLVFRSQLTWPACNMNAGDLGTFIQLVDFDLTKNVGRVGFAKFAPGTELSTDLSQGLCMVQGTYDDPQWVLPANMPMGQGWPAGLPPPMLLPYTFGPTQAKGLDADFDYAAHRTEILAKFAPGGEYQAAGFTGLFYLDRKNGRLHGFAPVAYVVVYDTATSLNVLPIRESEITAQINDPAHPNCVGVYRGDALDPASGCKGDLQKGNPAWGCPNNECPPMQAPNVTKGYFLITELEQVHNSLLSQTICNEDASIANGYGTDPAPATGCRQWAKWNPADPVNGLPMGDWCAETNSKATPTCHNAFRSISYAAFQGFRIQPNACPR